MTGIADAILYLKRPHSRDRRKRLLAHFLRPSPQARFAVLSWKRTGSNLLCGILYNHPEVVMHNELFNPIDIFTYHPQAFSGELREDGEGGVTAPRWSVLTRDLFPYDFLEYIWSGKDLGGQDIRPSFKAVGFKSFPEHYSDVRNEDFWQDAILEDLRVKKIILYRKDELAVYISMLRADETGRYMTYSYPEDLSFHIDPAAFQNFIDRYRTTFRKKYKSPIEKRDTFWICYEDLSKEDYFAEHVYPRLCQFLGVDPTARMKPLRETVKQGKPCEDLSRVIQNYEELEYCFKYSDVLHFSERRKLKQFKTPLAENGHCLDTADVVEQPATNGSTWSILLPICSRKVSLQTAPRHKHSVNSTTDDSINTNRFSELAASSQYSGQTPDGICCWELLLGFCDSLRATVDYSDLKNFECIVGIDIDDPIYSTQAARERLLEMIPCRVVFVNIHPDMYGKLCRIWSYLAKKTVNDYIVLLGDDIRLLDKGWYNRIARRFSDISKRTGLPFGAGCVAMKDLSFPGFPTFPVVHRWHVQKFGALLPKQFVNQGGDPYLYELYCRFGASEWEVGCRLENIIGGDGDARYKKHHINWRGHILNMNIRKLKKILSVKNPPGICLDIVVPSYRTNNNDYLQRIALLRASRDDIYVKFWFVVDNPSKDHINEVKKMASELNEKQLQHSGNYFINVIHYAANRGASYARNTGYNYSVADWILFLDDDVIPNDNIIDAYAGALQRYPDAKVLAGMTKLPEAQNIWTKMLKACNVGYFYGVSQRMRHPPWAVTANLLVRGSRFNPTIQFKDCYPKTGGGEDIDFVYQYKKFYLSMGMFATAAVPEAIVEHPWWRKGKTCYSQIMGWAWGDSMCTLQWPEKTFLTCPNWIEYTTFILPPLAVWTRKPLAGLIVGGSVVVLEHMIKTARYFPEALKQSTNILETLFVAFGAGTILSSQEITRVQATVYRWSFFSFCRRVDWFDGQEPRIKLDIQFGSVLRFAINLGITWVGLG